MSVQKSKQLCRFCNREMNVLFYCEDCGISCCSDCLRDDFIDDFVCQDCNSKDVTYNEKEGKKVCKECGKENVHKITQHFKSCPKCHSHNVLNIYEKKEELEQKFLELIKLSRSFIPDKDIINKLYLIRHKIKNARSPPIRCFHYPKMESDLLAIFNQIVYIKENLLEKIKAHFRHLALNKQYFFDIYNQPNSNIRIIESILESVSQNHDSINNFVNKNIKEIDEKLEYFQKNLQFIDKITKIFLPNQQFLNLAEREKPIYAVKTTLMNGLDPQKRFRKSKGILFITNFDLSFVHESGFIKKRKDLIFKAPIEDLIKIKDKGKLFRKLFIQFDYGKYEFSFPSNLISKIMEYILLARAFQENDIYDHGSAKQLHEMDLDLSDLVRYIEESIHSFFSIKCQINQNIINNKNKDEEPYFNNLLNYPQYWPQKGYNNYSMNNPAEESTLYSDINSQSPIPEDHNYYRNIYNPYMHQNFRPMDNHQYNGRFRDVDERNILMKRLEKVQKFDQQFPPATHGLRGDFERSNYRDFNPPFHDNNYHSFNDFHKNHLYDLFNHEEPSIDNILYDDEHLFEFDKKLYNKLVDYKKERFSLKETIKKLDAKFNEGIIDQAMYFKTFKNLQKEVYLIDKKIKSLTNKVKNDKSLRRRFNKKGYYS
ncbi:MAG: hypothetical protein EU529_16620 [Promethearchaeota archaeon]|nr:MAG: hypothetical protein EU529_16620 [Candidatus Lokiarchaeota archaeon]